MYDSLSKMIRQHKTAIDGNYEYREYVVYKKDSVYVTECIGWRIKSESLSGGSREYYQEFESEKVAIEKYEELMSAWETESKGA